MDLQQGFVLTRHWRDTPAGTQVEFWLASDQGPRRLRVACQPSVAFIPAEQRAWAEPLLRNEKGVELRELILRDFKRRPVLGLYCRQYRQLLQLEKKLRQVGVDVYEADIRPPDRYLMERFITASVLFDGIEQEDGSLLCKPFAIGIRRPGRSRRKLLTEMRLFIYRRLINSNFG